MPKRIVLDVDDTFDAVHGSQQLRLFNAHHDYGFQPIVVFDADGRFVTAVLRPAKRPKGAEIRAFLRRPVGAIRATWPQVGILLRAGSAFAREELMAWCEANRVDYVFGLARDDRLVPRSRPRWRSRLPKAGRPAGRGAALRISCGRRCPAGAGGGG